MYMTIKVKQVYWYISQISGERLQDHWSYGFFYFFLFVCLFVRLYVGCPESFETVSISQKLFKRISCNFTQEYNIIS